MEPQKTSPSFVPGAMVLCASMGLRHGAAENLGISLEQSAEIVGLQWGCGMEPQKTMIDSRSGMRMPFSLQWGCGMEPQKTRRAVTRDRPVKSLQWGCGMEPQKTMAGDERFTIGT